jgi:protein TonB
MLAYLAHRPTAAARRPNPNLLLLVIAGHVAVVAVVMSVKMDLPARIRELPTEVHFLPQPAPIPEIKPAPQPQPRNSHSTVPDPVVPIPSDPSTTTVDTPQLPLPLPIGPGSDGGGTQALPVPSTPAVLLTGPEELKPPYPAAKLASGEEAALKLRLTVDPEGRVVAIEPLGRSDRAFLDAARRHIMAHWRYRPATRDGHDVMATLVVTLRFQLDD